MAGLLLKFPGVALVTGAGGTGIGAAVAKAFASAGCTRLALTDINAKSLATTRDAIKAINPSAEVVLRDGDISSASFVESLFADAAKRFSRVDYAVSCAGILGRAALSHETDPADFDKILSVNLRGTWLASRAALARMRTQTPLDAHPAQRGSVVNIASQLGVVARPAASAYCASKAAIINMTRADAIDYATEGIRVNCVCPGVIETPMTVGDRETVERLKPAINIAPMRRMGKAEEVADAVLWLCSEKASFVQGHALVVDGGYTIN